VVPAGCGLVPQPGPTLSPPLRRPYRRAVARSPHLHPACPKDRSRTSGACDFRTSGPPMTSSPERTKVSRRRGRTGSTPSTKVRASAHIVPRSPQGLRALSISSASDTQCRGCGTCLPDRTLEADEVDRPVARAILVIVNARSFGAMSLSELVGSCNSLQSARHPRRPVLPFGSFSPASVVRRPQAYVRMNYVPESLGSSAPGSALCDATADV
jgi:hypothetical protein